jgi:NAD(P)-dependent dehydrogenase (short-subunit alcohol dehydrogenase family)
MAPTPALPVLLVTGGGRGIGAATLRLLSPEASYTTMALVDVSGGR